MPELSKRLSAYYVKQMIKFIACSINISFTLTISQFSLACSTAIHERFFEVLSRSNWRHCLCLFLRQFYSRFTILKLSLSWICDRILFLHQDIYKHLHIFPLHLYEIKSERLRLAVLLRHQYLRGTDVPGSLWKVDLLENLLQTKKLGHSRLGFGCRWCRCCWVTPSISTFSWELQSAWIKCYFYFVIALCVLYYFLFHWLNVSYFTLLHVCIQWYRSIIFTSMCIFSVYLLLSVTFISHKEDWTFPYIFVTSILRCVK